MFTLIGIEADFPEAYKSIVKLFGDKGCISEEETEVEISLIDESGWTVMIIDNFMPMPKLSEDISKILNCKVITVGYSDIDSSFHYSEVKDGELLKVYTYLYGSVREKKGLTLMEVFNTATQKKQFSISHDFVATEESLECGSENFFSAYSEIDLLPIMYQGQTEEGSYERIYVKYLPYKFYGFGQNGMTWEELMEE